MAIAGFELVDDFLQLPLAIAAESLAQYATYLSLLITTQNVTFINSFIPISPYHDWINNYNCILLFC